MINSLMVADMTCFQKKGSQLQDNQLTSNRHLGLNSAKLHEGKR